MLLFIFINLTSLYANLIILLFLFPVNTKSDIVSTDNTLINEDQFEFNDTIQNECLTFETVENGVVTIRDRFAEIKCKRDFYLEGPPIVSCLNGKWLMYTSPKCVAMCFPPPLLNNGSVRIDGEKDQIGLFRKGAVATYACHQGFKLTPTYSETRICENGEWSGSNLISCTRITNCPKPKDITNGYFVHENKFGNLNDIGQRLHYNCKNGWRLDGAPFQLCLEDGSWSPKRQPECVEILQQQTLMPEESSIDYPCLDVPKVPHSDHKIIQGSIISEIAEPQTIIEFHCLSKYRNIGGACKPVQMSCVNGRWISRDKYPPYCIPVHSCEQPPIVPFAVFESFEENTLGIKRSSYPFKSKVIYQCIPGYSLQGNAILGCGVDGCWTPEPPSCLRMGSTNYFMEVNNMNAVVISAATGAGVLGMLLVICLIATMCRRRKPLNGSGSRTVPISSPSSSVHRIDLSMGDHATLLAHPDRLALIAFADGMQNDQATLPSYDEATRDDRLPNFLSSSRLLMHRPHWPITNLGGRRSANNTRNNSDILVQVARHGSFVSHTPSTRSAADSMGSTDTMAVSEGSTNVTLDTVSSHSSQPASCRVHCGSLASFDTSSVINNEGVPLLEESELEEIQANGIIDDTTSLPMMVMLDGGGDNASTKINTADLS